MFLFGTNAFVIAGLLPDIAESLHVEPVQVSYSITWYSAVVALIAPVISLTLARVSRTTLMVAGLLLFALGGVLALSTDSIVLFTLGRAVAGLGGAAFVPTGTAAAAALVAPAQRGRALGLVGVGFTLATALGSPIGTLLGDRGGWRLPLWGLVALAVLAAAAIALRVRHVPIAAPASLAERLRPLADPRVLAALGATLLTVASFNMVYIFSSTVTAHATGGDGTALAVLLLACGVAGVGGNTIAGPLTDAVGNRRTAGIALGGAAVALIALTFLSHLFVPTLVVFAVWGLAALGASVPVQHRLVTIDPDTSALALSWYTTAMYIGIAVAPPIASLALGIGGADALPVVGAIVAVAALAVFLVGYSAPVRRVMSSR
jgi:DHA1 family inner membrane transport protein